MAHLLDISSGEGISSLYAILGVTAYGCRYKIQIAGFGIGWFLFVLLPQPLSLVAVFLGGSGSPISFFALVPLSQFELIQHFFSLSPVGLAAGQERIEF